jgi:pimeloyl-ACP methyl ester carboxylesterase
VFFLDGFFCPLRLYQNYAENREFRKSTKEVVLKIPCLMVTAGKDFVLRPKYSYHMEKLIPNLTRFQVDGASHWIMEEFPEECNSYLLRFIRKVKPEAKL